MNLNPLPDNITVHDPTIVPMDVALEKAFAHFKMPRLGGASGRGWSSYRNLMACPRRFYLRYIAQVRGEERAALGVGSCWHTYLALYYENMKALMTGTDEGPAPSAMRDQLLEEKADAVLIAEAWRLFECYADHWEGVGDYLEPLAIEHWVEDPRTHRTARYDLIARVTDEGKSHGIVPGIYVIEHKCVPADTEIFDYNTGCLETIGGLFAKQLAPSVLALRERGDLVVARAEIPRPNQVRDAYQVTLRSGRSLTTSDNHPFMTARGWVCAAELTDNDWIAVPGTTTQATSGHKISDDELRLVGLLLGDGSMLDQISFSQSPGPVLDSFVSCVERLSIKYHKDTAEGRVPNIVLSQAQDSLARTLLESLGLYHCGSTDKHIPSQLRSLSTQQSGVLLGALWDTDGCIDVFEERRSNEGVQQKVRIVYVSRSYRLCTAIQSLLLTHGLPSTVTRSSVEYDGERRPYWMVKVVTRVGKRSFLARIREGRISCVKYSDDDLVTAFDAIKAGDDRPIPVNRFRHLEMNAIAYNALTSKAKTSVWASTLEHWLGDREDVQRILNEEVHWERVESIFVSGRQMMYDLTVPDHSNFVANDIITHNTSSAWGEKTANSFHLDGEIIGQVALWRKARPQLTRKFGKLQGVIINVVTKTKVPKCHREIVAPPTKVANAQWHDLDFWEATETFYRAANHWPKSLAACWDRYGPCDYVERCKTK